MNDLYQIILTKARKDENLMSLASTGSAEGNSTLGSLARFDISLLYQDLPTGMYARQLLNHVLDHCQLGTEFNLTLWKLDLFHLPEISEQAVLAACSSALVILSLRGDIGLEPPTESWLKQWIQRRGDDDEGALAVLIDCDMQRLDSVGQTLFRLQDITRDSQVRLFAGFVPSLPAKQAYPFQLELLDGDSPVPLANHSSLSSQIFQEGGLNE
jgi:hypothetical protein